MAAQKEIETIETEEIIPERKQTKTQYKTRDGKIFEYSSEAERYNQQLNIDEYLESFITVSDDSKNTWVLVKNEEELSSLVEVLYRNGIALNGTNRYNKFPMFLKWWIDNNYTRYSNKDRHTALSCDAIKSFFDALTIGLLN